VALWAMVGAKLLLPASLPIGLGFGALLTADAPAVSAAVKEEGRPRPVSETRGEGAPTPWEAPDPFPIVRVIAGVWLAGVVLVLTVLLVREVRFRRALAARPECADRELLSLVRECAAECGLARSPRVKLAPAEWGPAITGLFAPVLLLPADWREKFDGDTLRHVIFHEFEHVRSRDLWWDWCAAVLTAVHWFNPLVWLAAARFQADLELRCDARALAHLAPTERLAYGRTLLRLAESFLAPPAIAGLAPCVRNHPTLRHRITMITHPTQNSPALQALLAGAVGLVVCLSFGSARAQEAPGKDRTREGERTRESGEKAPAAREGDRAKEGERPREGERMRDGERARSAERDGDRPKSAERDGERPKSAERDGESRRTGERDGEGAKAGPRDGEGRRMREGEGARDGGRRPEGARDGERAGGPPLEIRVLGTGDDVRVGSETVPANRLRGFLKDYLADHKGRSVVIDADPATPYSAVAGVLDAVRDNGAKNAQIRPAAGR
jgi:beta-lactamase regulating signal transducer with metallopeptidase domain